MKIVDTKELKAKQAPQDNSYSRKLTILSWFIILVGIALHLRQYLFNRSLWFDEAILATDIINKPISQFIGPPVGFIAVSKLLVKYLGSSEYILRLFPFICGIASIFLFYKIARHYLQPKIVPLALGLFVLSDKLIYYSSELKQYSSDVAIVILLYLVAIELKSQKITPLKIILFGLIGAISLWFSHPALFILIGIGLGLSNLWFKNRDGSSIVRFFIVGLFWLASFVVLYFVSLRGVSKDQNLLNFWSNSFMPLPPKSLADINWFFDKFFDMFSNPIGLPLAGIAALCFLVGCASMYFKKREDFIILISTLILPLLASGLRKYPFEGRLLLFCIPAALIFISEGVDRIAYSMRQNTLMVAVPLVGLLFFHPLVTDVQRIVQPRTYEEIIPVISHIKQNWQASDVIYLYNGAMPAFKYYLKKYPFRQGEYVEGITSRHDYRNYINDLGRVRGKKRVWVLFSHVWKDEADFFMYQLNNMGKSLDAFGGNGSAVYLYDLSGS